MKTFLAAALTLSFAGVANSQAAAPTAAAVLDANHAAVGDLPAAGAAEFDYSHTGSGLTGPAVTRFDLATGAYVESQDADGVHNSDGYDGCVPWQQDISLAYTPQQGGDRVPMAVDLAYRNANLWWRPDRGGAEVAYVGREIEGGRALDHLSVAPRGGKRFDAWFDAETHRLARIAYDTQFLHMKETYSDYRREGGLNLPHKIASDPGMGAEGVETSVLDKVSFGPARPLSAYAMPTAPPTGAVIAGGAASTTVPFRLLNNHIYVQATVDGKGPYTFIVDTGGHTLLSPQLVQQVGLKSVGEGVSSGAGEGHSSLGFVRYGEIAIGGVRLKDQMGFATGIYDPSIEGIAVDGMVGFELIRRMVTTVDYGKQTITFTDPAKFRPSPALGVAVPFVFYDHLPFVAGSVAGLPTHFDIDTGSRSQIDFTSPFVKAHDLKARFSKGASAVVGWGVGGPSRSYVVRLTSLTLGGVPVEGVAAGLVEDKGGSMTDPNYDGNVGSGLLKRFVVTFDYAHQVMYLKRITPTPPDVGTFDRSGLWINAKDGGYAVTDVAKDSAGAEAGVAVGDVITAIDGQPAVADQLADARRKLRSEPVGTKVALTVRRGGESRAVTLTLRDQI
ncbi:aspartyl protease family protein [Phenylobacterium sp.]|uniref:aspartyl protease family protein n=1 Tax=Phenylobacterium sp. TaxID=1871053 RepID=UPI00122051CA|nr:aspartyl protease family protein [Phenylobacterium sp.]THD58506.1 MAG: PDZ domain-containing protein [Phenylobacterium sp.]